MALLVAGFQVFGFAVKRALDGFDAGPPAGGFGEDAVAVVQEADFSYVIFRQEKAAGKYHWRPWRRDEIG